MNKNIPIITVKNHAPHLYHTCRVLTLPGFYNEVQLELQSQLVMKRNNEHVHHQNKSIENRKQIKSPALKVNSKLSKL